MLSLSLGVDVAGARHIFPCASSAFVPVSLQAELEAREEETLTLKEAASAWVRTAAHGVHSMVKALSAEQERRRSSSMPSSGASIAAMATRIQQQQQLQRASALMAAH